MVKMISCELCLFHKSKNFLNQPKKIVPITQDFHEDSIHELIRVEHLEHSKF